MAKTGQPQSKPQVSSMLLVQLLSAALPASGAAQVERVKHMDRCTTTEALTPCSTACFAKLQLCAWHGLPAVA